MPRHRIAGLTPRQRRFVQEYLVDLNATRAAARAGYSGKTANVTAGKLLVNTGVVAAIARAQAERSRRLELTQDRVLEELRRVALSDPRDLVHPDGRPKQLHELTAATAAAIASVEVITRTRENGQRETVQRFRMAPKVAALELLAQHLGVIGKHAENVNLIALLDARTIASWSDESVATALAIVRQAKALVRPTSPLLDNPHASVEASANTPTDAIATADDSAGSAS